MKHTARSHDEDLQLLDSINRMSRQLSFRMDKKSQSEQPLFLQETIENLEEQVESIRNSQQTHNHRK